MKKTQQKALKTQPKKNLAIKNQKKLKTLITKGKKQGFLTYEEINELIPDGEVSADQIDNTLIMFGEMDITITDKENIPKQIAKLKAAEKDNQDRSESIARFRHGNRSCKNVPPRDGVGYPVEPRRGG